MARHYFYNGTQIDDFASGLGTIVSQIAHDSSPDTVLTEVDLPKADGKVVRDLHTGSKTITLSGAVKGSSLGDMESRLDALKRLLGNPGQLKITEYAETEITLCTFEEGENWTRENIDDPATDDAPIWDYSYYLTGTRALQLQASTASGPRSANLAGSFNIPLFWTDPATASIKLKVFIPTGSAAHVNSLRLRFEKTSGVNYYSATITGPFVDGWQVLSVPMNGGFTQTGSIGSTFDNIQLTLTSSGANVRIDRIWLADTGDSRTYDVTPSSSLSIPREHFHTTWAPFSVTFSCSDGFGRSDLDVRLAPSALAGQSRRSAFLPQLLGGTGPQHGSVSAYVATPRTNAGVEIYDHFVDRFDSYEGRYRHSIATFETNETWTGGTADTTHFRLGTQGRSFTVPSANTISMYKLAAADFSALANNENSRVWVHLVGAANVQTLGMRLHTTAGTAYFDATTTTNASGGALVDGWNLLSIKKRSFAATGAASWASIVREELRMTTTGAVTATFDSWRWENVLGPTGGVYHDLPSLTDAPLAEIGAAAANPAAMIFEQEPTLMYEFPTLRNRAVRNGELRLLVSIPLTFGSDEIITRFIARDTDQPVRVPVTDSGSHNSIAATWETRGGDQYFTLVDRDGLSVSSRATGYAASITRLSDPAYAPGYVWFRFICKDSLVRLEAKIVRSLSASGQFFGEDLADSKWFTVAEGTTNALHPGYWGFSHKVGEHVVQAELIDYDSGQTNMVRMLGPREDATHGVASVATGTSDAQYAGSKGNVSGSALRLNGGVMNTVSVLSLGSALGAPQFHRMLDGTSDLVSEYAIDGWHTFTDKPVAIKFTSGANDTYIRRAGTMFYLARDTSIPADTAPSPQFMEDSAGLPNGSPTAGVYIDAPRAAAFVTTEDGILVDLYRANAFPSTASTTPGRINPTNRPFCYPHIADVPIAPSTSYWLILIPGDTDNPGSWQIPYRADLVGVTPIVSWNGSAWVAQPYGGLVVVRGNGDDDALSSTGAELSYSPRFR